MKFEDVKIKFFFNYICIGKSGSGGVCLAVALLLAGLIIYTGCIPSTIVVDADPAETQPNLQGPTPASRPETGVGTSSPIINLAQSQNFYVAVMDVNLSANITASIKLPLTMAIIGELVALNRFKVIDRMNRDAILAEQGFQQTGCVDNACSVQAGRLLGVNRIVVCAVNLIGTKYNINIQVLNVETGQIEAVSEKSISCKEEDLPGWVKLTVRGLFN